MRRTFILLILALLFSSPLEAAVLNIVAIGASNTSGFGVGAHDAYPAQLQVLLRKKGIPAKVTNAGVLGDTTTGMLRRLDNATPKGTNIVILQPGANDLRFGFSKEQRAANIKAMVKRLRARDIRVIVFDPRSRPTFISGTISTLMWRPMPRSQLCWPQRSRQCPTAQPAVSTAGQPPSPRQP